MITAICRLAEGGRGQLAVLTGANIVTIADPMKALMLYREFRRLSPQEE
jgi:hypothetical protein